MDKELGTGWKKSSPYFSKTLSTYIILSYILILTLFITLLIPSLSTGSFAEEEYLEKTNLDDIEADIPDEFVKGYFNLVTVETEKDSIEVELHNQEAERTYVWSYDDTWEGNTTYMDMENTTYVDGSWTLSIGLHEDEPVGEWSLDIETDQSSNTFTVEVVEPSTSFSVTGDISFYLEPYQEETYSDEGTATFRNTGNVYMKIDVIYDDDNLTYDVPQDIFGPGESGEITFQYISTTSGILQFAPSVSIEPFAIRGVEPEADGNGNVAVRSQGAVGLNMGVTVGYQGYEQGQGENYEIQYEDSIEMSGDSEDTLTFYVYPHEEIDFNVVGSDVEILDISENKDDPLIPGEEGDKEIEITVQFRSHHEDDGTIDFILDGDTYTTEVQLTETAPQPGDEEVTFVEEQSETITLGIILIGGIVFIGAGRVWLSKRKGDED